MTESTEPRPLAVVEDALARLALLEDVGEGDATSELLPASLQGIGSVRAREPGVLSGAGAALAVFRVVDPSIEATGFKADGDAIAAGERLLYVKGTARSLLTAERCALNFLQHLSGIATLTARFVDAVRGTRVRITDTRKTVPGLRLLAKEAVIHGGGVNHRLGLYDAIMIKDNHIEAAGGLTEAVRLARAAARSPLPLVVEASNLREAEDAVRSNVGRILLDNMTPEQVAACVAAIRTVERTLPRDEDPAIRFIPESWREGDPWIQVEVSGGIRLDNAWSYALEGVDFLSVGALTHSAPALDLTMDLELLA